MFHADYSPGRRQQPVFRHADWSPPDTLFCRMEQRKLSEPDFSLVLFNVLDKYFHCASLPTYMRLAVPIPFELKFGSIAITFSKVRKTPRTELAHNKYSISGKILLLLLSLLLLFLLLFKA